MGRNIPGGDAGSDAEAGSSRPGDADREGRDGLVERVDEFGDQGQNREFARSVRSGESGEQGEPGDYDLGSALAGVADRQGAAGPADRGLLVERVDEQLRVVARRIRRLSRTGLEPLGLSPSQVRALLALARLGRSAVRENSVEGCPPSGPSARGRSTGGDMASAGLEQAPSNTGDAVGCRPAEQDDLTGGSLARPVRMGELARALDVVPRSATDVVVALEERGLVTRAADPGDGRAVVVTLTSDGLELLATLDRRRHRASAEVLAPLSDDRLAELDRLLGLVADSACRAVGQRPPP